MVDYVYTTVPGKVKPLLNKIREIGVPQKATIQWLKSIGYKSSNDGSLLGILKFIKFIDASGSPTARWTQYRGTKYKSVLGEAIREGYSELFSIYDDAHKRSQTDLDHVFSTSSSGGKQVIAKTISTFKTLVEEAEFGPDKDGENTSLHMPSGPLHAPIAPATASTRHSASGPSLHIDIQIHISPEASTDQIDQIFASMAKHLYGPGKAE